MFLPGLLPHPDAVGVGVAGGGTRRHGAVASGVVGYRAGIGQVSWRGLGAGRCASRYRSLTFYSRVEVKFGQIQCVF